MLRLLLLLLLLCCRWNPCGHARVGLPKSVRPLGLRLLGLRATAMKAKPEHWWSGGGGVVCAVAALLALAPLGAAFRRKKWARLGDAVALPLRRKGAIMDRRNFVLGGDASTASTCAPGAQLAGAGEQPTTT